jgi:eukaryotic-like serine/threonine-protein kinase
VVLDTLGSGAMGVVYLAEQQNPRRSIALKVIRPEAISPSLRARFEDETRVLARLKHPGIAAIYAAGSAVVDGQDCPYFAMELITGQPLDEHARALSLAEKIGLLREVCMAVEHAHQRGVIHRDLKPGNVLVDESGRPRVLDFGVARAIDSDSRAGELVGTLPYMSPEQLHASPDADTRADVYALGVMLHELLTGRRPFDLSAMTVSQAAEHILTTPVPPMISSGRNVPKDLEAITRCAIAVDPEKRYPSASALSDELARYLRNEPVLARPQSTLYISTRFVQRNTPLVIAAAFAVLLAAGGIGGISWQAIEATRGRAEALVQASRANAVSSFLTTMLSSVDPENALGAELTVRELLDESARSVSIELQDEPQTESAVLLAIANTYRGLGLLEEAQQMARKAVDSSLKGFGELSTSTAEANRALSMILTEHGQLENAQHHVELAITTLDRIHGSDSVESAIARGDLARIYHESGRPTEALEVWTAVLNTLRSKIGEDDPRTLVVMHNYGSALGALGRFDEAVATLEQVIQTRTELFGDEHPQTIAARSMLAGVKQKQGNDAEAAEQFRAIVEARSHLFGDDHHSTLTAQANLAVALINLKQFNEAEVLTRAALDGYRRVLGPDHAKTLITMGNLAYLAEELGNLDEAAQLYREQIQARERSTGGRDPETWSSYNNLAMLLQSQGKLEEAKAYYQTLLALCEASLPADHVYTALFRNNYGECLLLMGDVQAAQSQLNSSHNILLNTFGSGHPRVEKSQGRLDKLASSLTEPR